MQKINTKKIEVLLSIAQGYVIDHLFLNLILLDKENNLIDVSSLNKNYCSNILFFSSSLNQNLVSIIDLKKMDRRINGIMVSLNCIKGNLEDFEGSKLDIMSFKNRELIFGKDLSLYGSKTNVLTLFVKKYETKWFFKELDIEVKRGSEDELKNMLKSIRSNPPQTKVKVENSNIKSVFCDGNSLKLNEFQDIKLVFNWKSDYKVNMYGFARRKEKMICLEEEKITNGTIGYQIYLKLLKNNIKELFFVLNVNDKDKGLGKVSNISMRLYSIGFYGVSNLLCVYKVIKKAKQAIKLNIKKQLLICKLIKKKNGWNFVSIGEPLSRELSGFLIYSKKNKLKYKSKLSIRRELSMKKFIPKKKRFEK